MIASRVKAESVHWSDAGAWRHAALFAAPTVAFVLYLYYQWFAVRDRYFIFLYFHDMGSPRFDTSPFGWVTVGRYWMTGFVAGGAVMLLYGAANFILGRIRKSYHAPVGWRVWLLCAAPLMVGVPAIVMTVNDPVLPLRHAAQVTGALLIALAVAVWSGEYAAHRPVTYLLLMVDGVALTGLSYLPEIENQLSRGNQAGAIMALVLAVIALLLMLVVSVIYTWRRQLTIPGAAAMFAAHAAVHYLFIPLVHHLLISTDGGSWRDPDYFTYIPTADNYFARNVPIQLVVWGALLLLAFGVTRLRVWLRSWRGSEPAPAM